MNGRMPVEIAVEYIRRLRAAGVLADAAHAGKLAGYGDTPAPLLGRPAELGDADPAAAPPHYRHHADDPVVITHTSGTTGVPKAVLHSHASLFAATRHLLTMPQAQGTARILSALPVPHTATVLMVNQALGNRAEMLVLSAQDGDRVLDAIQSWRPDGVFGFSVTWAELARYDLSAYDLDCVRLWFNTGDCTHEPHVRRLVAVGSRDTVTREGPARGEEPRSQGPASPAHGSTASHASRSRVVRVRGSNFIDGLGSSEMGHSMFHITHRTDTDRYGRCIGRPYRFVEAVVLDLDGTELPPGRVGHLGIRSPSLFRGYWNDSLTTYRSRLRGYYLTGDLVYRDVDGLFFHVDRAADAVDDGRGGRYYTALSEERVLAALPDVVDCTVVIVPGPTGVVTEVLLELAPGAGPADPGAEADRTARVRAALGPGLATTLRRVVVTGQDALPVTVTGKVRKVALRERHLAETAP
jgi:acyl-coenzyme A synthetase/AMP-(fatty) acid ligase